MQITTSTRSVEAQRSRVFRKPTTHLAFLWGFYLQRLASPPQKRNHLSRLRYRKGKHSPQAVFMGRTAWSDVVHFECRTRTTCLSWP